MSLSLADSAIDKSAQISRVEFPGGAFFSISIGQPLTSPHGILFCLFNGVGNQLLFGFLIPIVYLSY
jgi:hypothetical protein